MTSAPTSSGTTRDVVSYRELLSNPAMAVLLFARVLDPIAQTSIHSYMFAQLRWLSPDATSTEIAVHAGLLTASKTAAKCLTGLLWGRLSDQSFGGRRLVLLISLFTSAIAALGYGLSRTIVWAIFWQVFGGATSSAIGIIRCMVAEMEPRPTHRSRALLLLPLAGTCGQLLGPLLGGFLTSVRGPGLLGEYPFFLPNAIIAALYALSFVGSLFFVDETLEIFDRKKGSGFRQCLNRLLVLLRIRKQDGHAYARVSAEDDSNLVLSPTSEVHPDNDSPDPELQLKPALTFWQIWTAPVIFTLLAHFIIAGHVGTFNTAWAVFLASSISPPSSSFLRFTGGTGLIPAQIGTLMSVFALFGITLQTQLPRLNDRFSTVTVWRTSLFFFPLAYLIAPYCAYIASNTSSSTESPSDGRGPSGPSAATWVMLAITMAIYIVGRTGAQPSMTLLINACVPHPTARGTINVAGTVVGNLARSVFPVGLMAVYGWGAEHELMVLGFWVMSAMAGLAIVASWWVKGDDRVRKGPGSSSA